MEIRKDSYNYLLVLIFSWNLYLIGVFEIESFGKSMQFCFEITLSLWTTLNSVAIARFLTYWYVWHNYLWPNPYIYASNTFVLLHYWRNHMLTSRKYCTIIETALIWETVSYSVSVVTMQPDSIHGYNIWQNR